MPQPIDEASFQREVLDAHHAVVVDFSAPWCGPCKQLDRVLDELGAAYHGRLTVVTVDIDAAPALAQRFGVRSVPTLLGFARGAVVAQQVGFSRRARVQDMFDQVCAASDHAPLP
jgi:thioredoxin 1